MLDTADEVPTLDPRLSAKAQARSLYWQGWRVSYIAKHLGIARSTVQAWKDAEEWDKATPIHRVESALEARLVQLISKDAKTGGDFKEIDLLGRQIERIARVHKYSDSGREADLNPNIDARNAGPKRRPLRNDFTEEQVEKLEEAFNDSLFEYQKVWFRNGEKRTRIIVKSRQIGATWYFAREALLDAIKTGRNQIFLSASKKQAHVFKNYITRFAFEATGVKLSGDPIVLANGAELNFLGTNALTAQGYHGNFYFDEFFWTHQFEALNKVASAMASQKQYRKTYFSTPSSMQHQAYALWSGERFNKKRPKDQRIELDLSHKRLSSGFTGEDKIWRLICNLLDAERGGCDLFDIDELRFEYTPEEFANLFMCEFIDDTASIFPLAELQRCMVDSWETWTDIKPYARRPYGNRPVWIGYDPSYTGDTAGCVVVAPPTRPGGKFRILEHHQFRGMDFAAQADAIQKLTERYNVAYIGIDSTGMGQGVLQLVRQFFPAVREYQYSVDVKTRLVLKAKDVIAKGRLEFDAGATEIAHAFLTIRKTLTASGRNVTYDASRTEVTGHADLAWAVMHALDNEPLEGATPQNRGIMEIM
ncbi:terminase large subunit domain-containing protein [Cupriavidus nantongensis]|uniref:Terminase n=1 Tax=Cupriavidus nantongensis TaxID=1796606 RepID=A0A142JGV3_9BURK|nr:terminase family protein [Cupriavidus nantongensis]AMR77315.1 terminase [Cupriavidus nantongensis]